MTSKSDDTAVTPEIALLLEPTDSLFELIERTAIFISSSFLTVEETQRLPGATLSLAPKYIVDAPNAPLI